MEKKTFILKWTVNELSKSELKEQCKIILARNKLICQTIIPALVEMKIDNRTKNKNQLARKYFNSKLKENDTIMVQDIFANKFQKRYLGPFKIKSINKLSHVL
eukprot:gene8877-826_t